jgi:RNA polymerase sigma-70 factor (ECF subfamily)
MQEIPQDILIRAAEGDIAAFQEIYKVASSYVYNIAYRISSNNEEAEEITQDVFLKIYNHLKHFQFRSGIKTWIYRITVNTTINAAKKRSRELKRRVDFNEDILYQPSSEVLEQRLDKEENEALVNNLLKLLNPQQRACVVLRDIEGLSYKEIAQTLRININTVRSRLKRARETLLSAIKKE